MDSEIADQLYAAVNRMLEPFGKSVERGRGLGSAYLPPFDISRPVEHDTKADFLQECASVEAMSKALETIWDSIAPMEGDPSSEKMFVRLRDTISEKLTNNAPRGRLSNTLALIRKNVADTGGFTTSLLILLDLKTALDERLLELEGQRDSFWSLSHRAPDYYARAIALRLAKLYARETGQRPTFGTSGETGDPSTSYSRALRDIFKILQIETGERKPAEWAVMQINDEDLLPDVMKELGGLFGLGQQLLETENLTDQMPKLPRKKD